MEFLRSSLEVNKFLICMHDTWFNFQLPNFLAGEPRTGSENLP